MKLYHATTLVTEYDGCRDVRFCWFKPEPTPPARPYRDLINNYDEAAWGARYAELAIDELFAEDEAVQLAAYLDVEHGSHGTTTVKEATLPIANNTMGLGAIPVGGGHDEYLLHKESNYSLPFKVIGHFDLRGCLLIDGSGVFESRVLMFDTHGRPRWQTNVEAIR